MNRQKGILNLSMQVLLVSSNVIFTYMVFFI